MKANVLEAFPLLAPGETEGMPGRRQGEQTRNLVLSIPVLEARHGSLVHQGTIDEVLGSDEIDLDRLRSLTIESTASGPKITVGLFSREGVSCAVSGPPAWARSSVAELDNELKRYQPWWAVMRSGPAAILYGWVFSGSVLLAIRGLRFTQNHKVQGTGAQVIGNVFVAVVFAIGGALAIGWLVKRLLPGFEVVSPTKQSRGGRAMAVISGILAQFLLGLAINFITR